MTVFGFTGSRHGMTVKQTYTVSNFLSDLHITTVHHGDCLGSDEEVHWLAVKFDLHVVVHPPEDNRWRAYCPLVFNLVTILPVKPYHDRNRDIVDSCDILLATPQQVNDPGKGGTWYTINYAKEQDKPVRIILPDGSLRLEGGGT